MVERGGLQPTAVGWPTDHHVDVVAHDTSAALGWPVDRVGPERQPRESAARIWRRSVHAHVVEEPKEADVSRETSEAEETAAAPAEINVSRETSPPESLAVDAGQSAPSDVSRETSAAA